MSNKIVSTFWLSVSLCLLAFGASVSVSAHPQDVQLAPIPVIQPEFHFSNESFDAEYRKSNITVENSYQAFGAATTIAYKSLAARKQADIGSVEWKAARDAVINVAQQRISLLKALRDRIMLLQYARSSVSPDELDVLNSVISASQDGIDGTNEIMVRMLIDLAK